MFRTLQSITSHCQAKWGQGLRAVITALMVSLVVAALTDCAPTQRASKEESEPIEPSSSNQQPTKQNTNVDTGQKSTSRKLWVRFSYCFEDIHREVAL
jgi:hypothetical protein